MDTMKQNQCTFRKIGDETKIVVEKSSKKHTYYIGGSVYFPDPVNKLVTVSWDQYIIIWDSKNLVEIAKLKAKEDWRYIIKYNSSVFIAGAQAKNKIIAFSIFPPYNVVKIFSYPKSCLKLQRLFDDNFVSVYSIGTTTFSYDRGIEISNSKEKNLYFIDPELDVGKMKHEKCFFICKCDFRIDSTIFKIHYVTGETMDTFKEHPMEEKMLTIRTFLSSKNEELLLTGGYSGQCYVYNTSLGKDSKKRFICKSEPFSSRVYTSRVLGNNFFVMGGIGGKLVVFHFDEKKNEIKELASYKLHNEGIWDIKYFEEENNKENEGFVEVITTSFDYWVKKVRIYGIKAEKGRKKMEEEDEKERKEFLCLDLENFCFTEEIKKSIFVDVKLSNLELSDIMRVFLL